MIQIDGSDPTHYQDLANDIREVLPFIKRILNYY